MKPLNLKLQVIEDEEFRNLVKELIKSQILNITREQIKDVTNNLINEKRENIERSLKQYTGKSQIENIVRGFIEEEIGRIDWGYSNENKMFMEFFKEVVKEETMQFFHRQNIMNIIMQVIKNCVEEKIKDLKSFQEIIK